MGRRHIRPGPQIAADTTIDSDTSLAMYAGHQPSRRAVVAEAADGQSADRSLQLSLLFLKAGPAGGRLRRPSSAGSAATTLAAMPQLQADSFYRELAQRLAPVLPPLVEVSPHPRVPGLRLVGPKGSGLLFPTLVTPGPFRFRLRVSAKTVLGGVQAFVVHVLHRPWPEAEGIGISALDNLPKPGAATTRDSLRLWYEVNGRPVLELQPISLDRVRR
jgi:hypothetical protein